MNRVVVLQTCTRMFGGKCSVCPTQLNSILLMTIKVGFCWGVELNLRKFWSPLILSWVCLLDSTPLYPAHDYKGLLVIIYANSALLIPHCILRADLHHSWRGEAAQPTSDEAKGRVHRADGRPRSSLSQEDWWEPACQYGMWTAGPPWEDEGLGVT